VPPEADSASEYEKPAVPSGSSVVSTVSDGVGGAVLWKCFEFRENVLPTAKDRRDRGERRQRGQERGKGGLIGKPASKDRGRRR
jgi:hypothetical protein